jgi:hypothetical protein
VSIDGLHLALLLQHPLQVNTQRLLIGERQIRKGTEALAVDPQLFTAVLANELIEVDPSDKTKKFEK